MACRLPVLVALADRLPLHLVARGVVHRRPVHRQLRVARRDRQPRHPRGVVVAHRHRHLVDRDAAVVVVRARRAVGQRDRIVRRVRIVARGHRHRLRRFPVRRGERQGGRVRGHVRARVPGHRHRDIRRRLGIQRHRVAVPGRVLLRHRQRRLRHRDTRRGRHRRRVPHLRRRRAVVGVGPRRAHPHRVLGAVGQARDRVARRRARWDRELPVAGVVVLADRLPLHLVARGVVHRRPVHRQPRVARRDRHPRDLRGVVVAHRHRHLVDRDAAVVVVRARRAVGQRDRIVRRVRIVARGHRHRLRRFPVRRGERQGGRVRGHVRARVPGHRHRDIRRRLGIQRHRVAVPGRVLLRHRQRRRRHRDTRRRRGALRLRRRRTVVGAGPRRAHPRRVLGAVGETVIVTLVSVPGVTVACRLVVL